MNVAEIRGTVQYIIEGHDSVLLQPVVLLVFALRYLQSILYSERRNNKALSSQPVLVLSHEEDNQSFQESI